MNTPRFLNKLLLALPLVMVPLLSAATVPYDEVGGKVVVEAEHFTIKIDDPDGHHYHIVPDDDGKDSFKDTHGNDYLNARGGKYIVALPDTAGGGVNHNNPTQSGGPPSVDYLVNINTPGDYRLWLRWKAYDGSSDSMYAQILEIASPQWYRYGAGVAPTDSDFASTTSGAGWDGLAAPEVVSGGGGEVPAVYTLAGGVYTIRLAMREDGAAIDAILLQLVSLPDPTNPGPAESSPATSYIAISTPPVDTLGAPGKTATFSVVVSGTGTLTYQWQSKAPGTSAFSNIAGATTTSYTTTPTTDAMNGTLYRVVVANGTKTVNSAAAKLGTDGIPPSVVAIVGGQSGISASVVFSEKVDTTTAQAAANYTITGLAVISATLAADGRTVVLVTAKQTPEAAYAVSVNGVKDVSGNLMTVTGKGSFTGPTLISGKVLVRFYNNIGGTAVSDLLNSPSYPDSPTSAALWDTLSSGDGTGDTFGDNYGAELTGFFTPPTTGNYKFYIRSDDASRFLLSTDATEAGLRQIAQQPGCCNGFTDTPGSLSSLPIALTKGLPYFFKAYLKEGGGGDFIQVGVLGPSDASLDDASAVVPIAGNFLGTGFSKTATLLVSQQPANVIVGASSPAKFTVGFNARSVLGTRASIQWQRAAAGSSTFADIPGATGATYTIVFPTAADSGSKFRATASITFDEPTLGSTAGAISDAATLTVSADTIPPVVTGVVGGLKQIVVSFNEPLTTSSAETVAYYQVNGGPTATAAKIISAAGTVGKVAVTISGATPGATYSVTISGVKDLAGNPVAATTRTFESYHIISDYNDGGTPVGSTLAGSANIKASGGLDGSGFLELTTNAGSLQGSIFYDDVLGGAAVTKFTAQFKLYIGNGSGNPADGFSFALASDLMSDPAAPVAFSEEGTGSGLIVAFDTYDNGGGEAPAISVKFNGVEFAVTNVVKSALVNNRWVDVLIRVNAGGAIDVFHDNIKYFEKLPIDGWSPIAGAQLGFGGRTGGEYERNWVDNLKVVYNADIAVNEPPSVVITSLTDGMKIPAGSAGTIQVNAQDKENQIAKVEFFANGAKIGESTKAPYSFSIPNIPTGAYLFYARITDVPGLSTVSPTIKIIAGNPDTILFVTADPGPLTYPGDQAIYQHLLSRGYDVNLTTGTAVPDDGATATGNVLVIISSSLGSGTVVAAAGGAKFLNSKVPVMEWEASNQDDFRFQAANGNTGADQTQINIVDASHPLAAGFPVGLRTVTSSPQIFSQGTPVGAHVIATSAADPTIAVIYCYEKGDKSDANFAQPARRAFFFFQDNTATAATDDGWKLFDAEMDWLLGKGAVTTQPVISFSRNGTSITLTSTPAGILQSTLSLGGTIIWNDLGTSPQTVNMTTETRFFRVKQ